MSADGTSWPDTSAGAEASQPVELLLTVARDGPRTLGAQIEEQLRAAIRDGTLKPGARVPSTRDLARQLGVSRRIAVDAYAQLAAEGFLTLRQGARPHVSGAAAGDPGPAAAHEPVPAALRYDFRPSVPDVSAFPRAAWARALRTALAGMTDAELAYSDPRGARVLREALAEYLGRVRGVVAVPGRVLVTSGYTQGLDVVLHALAARGARMLAVEDPSDPEAEWSATRAGLRSVRVAVDDEGIRVDALAASGADAVVLTPAHQHPTGVVLSSARRAQLVAWLRERGAVAIEDDYDAEYRYDRAAVGALQGLDPEHVVYAGSASKTLAPALRLGWLVLPPGLVEPVAHQKLLADRGTARIEQHALADFLARGELDRHLRRMRIRYRARRDALVAALAEELPEARVRGIAAGLHATVELTAGDDEAAILAEAARRRLGLMALGEVRSGDASGPATLLVGYAQLSEPGIPAAVRELAAAVRAARAAS
ncbi:MAG TPA: PLP-dependent aminotransferase family protein [Solirubrobacteraceae bacterium]|nr:PLP-dependent aminotransferase family protein [Solirubrobacteraceae bacterium]